MAIAASIVKTTDGTFESEEAALMAAQEMMEMGG